MIPFCHWERVRTLWLWPRLDRVEIAILPPEIVGPTWAARVRLANHLRRTGVAIARLQREYQDPSR